MGRPVVYELLNDIHGDSGGYLHQTISSIILQRLATVGFTGTNSIQSHPPTHRILAKRLLMIFMTYNSPNHSICEGHSQGNVRQRFSAQFSFSLLISA